MTQLLLRIFAGGAKDPQNPAIRGAIGKLSGTVGIISNLLLFAIKLAAGTLANSVSITADALNNLSDATSSIVTLLGFKLAERPADEHHPYGHARYVALRISQRWLTSAYPCRSRVSSIFTRKKRVVIT